MAVSRDAFTFDDAADQDVFGVYAVRMPHGVAPHIIEQEYAAGYVELDPAMAYARRLHLLERVGDDYQVIRDHRLGGLDACIQGGIA